jgi:hypothetical protein
MICLPFLSQASDEEYSNRMFVGSPEGTCSVVKCEGTKRMRRSKIRFFIVGFLAIVTALLSEGQGASAESIDGLEFHLDAGYRIDELDWNISGSIDSSNIVSELTWDDLEIYQVRGGGKLDFGNEGAPFTVSLKGTVGYGWIVDGENQDSDFAGDNPTQEFSRSNNSSDDGDVFDVSAAIGPRLKVLPDKLAITPLAGFSYHEQNLTMTDGFQTLSRPEIDPRVPPTGPFAGLDSTYETQWYGPWIGLDVTLRPVERFMLSGSLEYHWVDFEAQANWNLRDDFAHPKSFEHEADGDGIVLALGGKYDLADQWAIHLNLDYQDWKAENGVIRFFSASGGDDVQRLNEVNWESHAVILGVTYRFL